jgi:hypothetical protein
MSIFKLIEFIQFDKNVFAYVSGFTKLKVDIFRLL